ncbi:MAG: UxaA family hydrolase [Candidatus Sumerlaeia bacterium]
MAAEKGEEMQKLLTIHPDDNVAVALASLEKGLSIDAITIAEDIPFAFKIAVKDIPAGDAVIKYGETIGLATRDIQAGALVHVHNIRSLRAQGESHD